MGIPVLCMGASGSGKSTGMRNRDKKATAIFNVAGKPLPFRGKFDMMCSTSDPDGIISILSRNTTKCYVIDDSQYMISFKLIDKWQENGYTKYTEVARDFKRLIDTIISKTSPDTIVYFLHHTETLDDGKVKAKTSGKMIDNWLTLEGLFSIVIMAVATENKHLFVTQSDGMNTCKSPMGMLENPMENDLALVDKAIREYYELAPVGLRKGKQKEVSVTTAKEMPR
jgi:hypothetical protein